ncbi:ROK family glucokinase [Faecalicatena orotica]|uniref:Glucokinase n=1 Tax=Faecalicatena orotica TaxID=1544 RepID=A0A2Y9B9L0_9FIRM|nr:ROK family glucokinase [Faecalicatena orotica]PWJ32367.1 glucokinase [Faecalicatena orotica]SSA54201.1 glucokinase [Faecalicatena orotica]
MKKYAFGVDIGGTTVKLGLFETDGNLLEMWEIPTRTVSGGKFILGDISEAAYEKLSERGISHLDVEGIGMGVPGPVGQDGTVFKCVNLGWDVFNVERELGELTGMRVKAGNDANVAALGEMWQGGGKGCSNIVMITLGTGVGGGVIIDGHILAGYNGAAGEIGHLPMTDDETECCGCGKKGCLEQYASATGIVRMTKKYLDAHKDIDSSLRSIETFSAKDIFDAAKAKDEAAVVMVSELGRMLGKGLAQIACVVNPEAFVIGGGVAKAGDILLDAIREHYVEYAFHASRDTEFRLASLGNEAGIYGGVKLIIG